MLQAGRLRHRIILQAPVETQDVSTGAMEVIWVNEARLWSAIEPLSAREFIASQAEQSKVIARITIRYTGNISPNMRLYHEAQNKYYNIEGVLPDKDSGLEYITLPVSEGVNYQV